MTTSTEGISRPLEATSVAIKMFLSFDLNRFREFRRYCCDKLPLILTALKLRFLSIRASYRDDLRVDVKIIVFLPANCVNRNTRYVSLYFDGLNR